MSEQVLTLGQKKIVVLDGKITSTEAKKLSEICGASQLMRVGSTQGGATDTTLHYVARGDLSVLKHSKVFSLLTEELARFFPGHAQCNRVIYRELVYGDHVSYHTDALDGQVTAMLYLNDEWQADWRGETVFLDENQIGIAVLPVPGRLVFFDAALKHTSSAPARIYYGARKILVFNFSRT